MRLSHGLVFALGLGLLASCNSQDALVGIEHVSNRVEHPLPAKMRSKLAKMNLSMSSPIMMRIFKEEAVMEVWKANSQDRYQLVATYPICAWSGQLGPKKKEGDRQAPEGFYTITPAQMNPSSSYYLSFDMGYPNKFDRAYGRSGRNLMVHGACSSSGCYSISDAAVLQVYAFARDAFKGGQKSFQIQAFPFRMTAENMAKRRSSEHYEFWKNLKTGYDHFEITHRPPVVDVCGKKYAFNEVGGCNSGTPPALTAAYQSYSKSYEQAFNASTTKYSADWKDTAEWDRKAQERLDRRMGKVRAIPNDADYVVVDAQAKKSMTSDAVASYSEAKKKVEDIKKGVRPTVEYISVAEVAYRKKLADEKRKEDEKLEKRLAKARIPVPEPNPIKPVMQAYVAEEQDEDAPFWKVWERKIKSAPPVEVTTADPNALPVVVDGTAKTDEKKAIKTEAVAAKKPADAKADQAEQAVQPPVAAADSQPKEKPFWKVW
ncbi:L,D-transpeptidase family protein [Rhizobium sp. TH2]|uniref:L,D-transpeptidase family protein n=1 Tax=Rhizobium sp. TH2 TaxID=2775403 RepID=UPI002157CEFA|nr:L,D-transpeptidase family protein [Rhizobium sp. TH2]